MNNQNAQTWQILSGLEMLKMFNNILCDYFRAVNRKMPAICINRFSFVNYLTLRIITKSIIRVYKSNIFNMSQFIL